MDKPYIVGITGGSGSGKSHFINRLLKEFNQEDICVVSQDHYYKSRDSQPKDPVGVKNFDTPDSMDLDLFFNDIKTLITGQEVIKKEYTYNNPLKKPAKITLKPSPLIVLEGLFIFHHQSIADLMDLKIFIDAKPHIKLKRRILRDKTERGYDLDDVLYRFEKHVMPAYEKIIEPYRHVSDLIIPNNHGFDEALRILTIYLKSKLV